MTSTIEEDFELELRSLPGVVNVGIDHRESGEVDSVVLSIRNQDPEAVRESAVQVASLYYPDAAVILEEAGPRAAPVRGGHAARIALVRGRVQRARRRQRGAAELRRPHGRRPGRQRPADRRAPRRRWARCATSGTSSPST